MSSCQICLYSDKLTAWTCVDKHGYTLCPFEPSFLSCLYSTLLLSSPVPIAIMGWSLLTITTFFAVVFMWLIFTGVATYPTLHFTKTDPSINVFKRVNCNYHKNIREIK